MQTESLFRKVLIVLIIGGLANNFCSSAYAQEAESLDSMWKEVSSAGGDQAQSAKADSSKSDAANIKTEPIKSDSANSDSQTKSENSAGVNLTTSSPEPTAAKENNSKSELEPSNKNTEAESDQESTQEATKTKSINKQVNKKDKDSAKKANQKSTKNSSAKDGKKDDLQPAPQDSAENKDSSEAADQSNMILVPADPGPMCKLATLKEARIVNKSSWVGVGPFREADAAVDTFVDEDANSLKLKVDGEDVVEARLRVGLDVVKGQELLGLKVVSDNLLEGLGLSSARIDKFNQILDAQGVVLTDEASAAPLSVKAGNYMVGLVRADWKGEGKQRFDITVYNRFTKSGTVVSKPNTDTKVDDSRVVMTLSPEELAKQAENKLKEEFQSVIQSWQNIKKEAIHDRKTDNLSKVLAGKALSRQLTAVNWLANNNKYYDLAPKNSVVLGFKDLGGGKKYQVTVQIEENSKLIDESSKQVLKDVDDAYKVNYTMDKINSNWFIVDSAIVDPQQSGGK